MQIFFSGNGKKLVFIKVVISDYLKNVRARAAGTSSCLLSVLILLTIDLHNSSKDSPTPQQQIMIFPAHFHLSYTSYRKGPSISKASSPQYCLPSLPPPHRNYSRKLPYHAISRRWQQVLGLSGAFWGFPWQVLGLSITMTGKRQGQQRRWTGSNQNYTQYFIYLPPEHNHNFELLPS